MAESLKAQNWKPQRKVASAAVAALLVWLGQLLFGLEVPVGIEGAIAVLVSYFVPEGGGPDAAGDA